jgi:hypothetical protein
MNVRMPRIAAVAALFLSALAGLACAGRPIQGTGAPPPPAAEGSPARFEPGAPYAGGDGTSEEKAVLVEADNEEDGVLWERQWIFDHYGRFRRKSVGLAAANGRHYDVFVVELADHSEKTIFFDCTKFLGREKGK